MPGPDGAGSVPYDSAFSCGAGRGALKTPNNDERKSPAWAGDPNAASAAKATDAAILRVNEKPAMIHPIHKCRPDLERRALRKLWRTGALRGDLQCWLKRC